MDANKETDFDILTLYKWVTNSATGVQLERNLMSVKACDVLHSFIYIKQFNEA